MTKQEIINEQVQARLARANALLIKKNGVDPNDSRYQKKKADIIYAWQHGIDYTEVAKHKRGKLPPKEIVHPTAAEVEKMLGRPLRTTRPKGPTATGYAVRDVLTGKRYDSIQDVAAANGIYWSTVRRKIECKEMFPNQTYYEYV